MESAGEFVDRLKAHFRAETDSDLARILAVDKRTVSAWRARGSVPPRYVKMLEGDSHSSVLTPPLRWGEYEKEAFNLALFRTARALRGTVEQGSYREQFDTFRMAGAAFWLLMRDAQIELTARMEGSDVPIQTAFALLVHDDLAAGNHAVERDLERLTFLSHSTPE